MVTSMPILVRKSRDEWFTQIVSKNLQFRINLFLGDDGSRIVELSDLNITSLEEINSPWKLTPENFPSFHLISKDAIVNGKPIPNLEADLTQPWPRSWRLTT